MAYCLRDFAFVLDGKLPSKLGAGEKFLRDSILPILGSNARFNLALPDTWNSADPAYPFIERFESSGGWSGARRQHVEEDVIDLSAIFENGLRFEPSHEHAGLQVADIVAYVVRHAALNPDDERAQLAYDLIREKLRHVDGRPLRLIRLSSGGAGISGARYRRLA